MKPRVLATRPLFEGAMAYLAERAELTVAPASAEALHETQGLVCQLTDPVPAAFMDAAPQLKVIANVAVGYDNIDVAAATDRGIVVTNTPGVLTDTTADLAFALILATARRIVEADRFLRAGHFDRWEIDLLCGHDVHHRTLGLVGLGRIGRAVAKRAAGFDMRVLFHDPTVEGSVSFETLLEESDFVSLHCPLTPGTRHLIGAEELARMKPNAILVNTARGPIVDESALADALEQGSIAGAGLDVYESEPSVAPRLLKMDNVVLLPHIGSASLATRERMCSMAAEDCIAVLEGREPRHRVPEQAG